MTRDEFQALAWRDFILFAAQEPIICAEFTDATGVQFLEPAHSPIEAAIDGVTGVHERIYHTFIEWATREYWGLDEAPQAYRDSIVESR